jgi:hypothetical protein
MVSISIIERSYDMPYFMCGFIWVSGIGAELGLMRVTEQIDAMEVSKQTIQILL